MSSYSKGDIGLKAVATTTMRNKLRSIALHTDVALGDASQFMFPIAKKDSFSVVKGLACVAMPMSSQLLLAHLVTKLKLPFGIEEIKGSIDDIVPIQNDKPLMDYLLKTSSNEDLFKDEKLPDCFGSLLEMQDHAMISSNTMHRVLNQLVGRLNQSNQNVHSESIAQSLLNAQFNSLVSTALVEASDMDEMATRKLLATEILEKAMAVNPQAYESPKPGDEY
jgi:hypothetical protein